ncbi:hypothetical protein M404DRAFT_1001982 [Pisolithus tinctorius Marx 270]|uniref:Uncharacterized protein n=1 Tax=Pisolithus tinctorius Marx 270 TaxID=870435 RepID=A0A0C3NPF7_PISTI|nr:hypothetical protein M404DRAFT_1001982 [Pisolithus tinctorius Marx 270]
MPTTSESDNPWSIIAPATCCIGLVFRPATAGTATDLKLDTCSRFRLLASLTLRVTRQQSARGSQGISCIHHSYK